MRLLRFILIVASVVLVGGVVGVSGSSGGGLGGVDVVDEATFGERSNQTVCDEDEIRCVDALLESSAWRCSGVDASSFSCNVSFWLNLTVRGPSVCASGGINVTGELAPEACTSTIEPVAYEEGGPVALTFDAGDEERLVNISGEVCLEPASSSMMCEEWDHDPILLPSWEQWSNEHSRLIGPAFDHQFCFGDSSGGEASGDMGPGCVSAMFIEDSHCEGILEDYHCVITLDLRLATHGLGLCASLETDYAEGAWEVTCNFRQHLGRFSWEEDRITERYEHDEIPLEGRTVLVEAELCGWAFRPFAQQYCETFYKPVRLGGDPCACDGDAMDGVTDAAEGHSTHALEVVNQTTAPSVYP